MKFVLNIPISRDEAESENHLFRGLLSVPAPTPSGSGKSLFAGWHPPSGIKERVKRGDGVTRSGKC